MKRYCECSVFLINFRGLLAKSAGYFYGPPDIHVLRRNDMKNAPLSTTMVTYTTQLPVILSFENLLLQQWTLNLLLWSKIYLLKYLYSDYRRGIRKRKIVYSTIYDAGKTCSWWTNPKKLNSWHFLQRCSLESEVAAAPRFNVSSGSLSAEALYAVIGWPRANNGRLDPRRGLYVCYRFSYPLQTFVSNPRTPVKQALIRTYLIFAWSRFHFAIATLPLLPQTPLVLLLLLFSISDAGLQMPGDFLTGRSSGTAEAVMPTVGVACRWTVAVFWQTADAAAAAAAAARSDP